LPDQKIPTGEFIPNRFRTRSAGLRAGVAHYVLDENDGLAEIGSALKREQEPALRS
jgi:hypothetical protein